MTNTGGAQALRRWRKPPRRAARLNAIPALAFRCWHSGVGVAGGQFPTDRIEPRHETTRIGPASAIGRRRPSFVAAGSSPCTGIIMVDALRSLDRYIFRQCLTPLIFAVLVSTGIVWMTQALQRIDIVVEFGASVAMFLWLSVLIVPSLVAVIAPFALFAAALYALQRLHADSEVAVMFASGVSRWRIAAPLLVLASLTAALTLWVNLDLMPRSYRTLKFEVANIRADIASTVLKSGEFTPVAGRMTIYVERTRPGGQFEGLLVNDYSEPERPATYMAQKGVIRETAQGPVLYLFNGNIQRRDVGQVDILQADDKRRDLLSTGPASKPIDIVNFTDTAINISGYRNSDAPVQLELTERYLSELFNPDLSKDWDRDNADKLITEGHARLTAPLYAFAYVVLALYAIIGGAYARRGYGVRIALACAAAAGLRIAGFLVQGVTAEAGFLRGAHWLHYAIPLGGALMFATLLSRRQRISGQKTKSRKAQPRSSKKKTAKTQTAPLRSTEPA